MPTTDNERLSSSNPGFNGTAVTLQAPDASQAETAQHGFSRVVSVLMRDKHFRRLPISELENFVLPPVMAGQWRINRGTFAVPPGTAGASRTILIPAAAALWACVSDTVDARLSNAGEKALQLQPDDWTSGNHIWLTVLAGSQRHMPQLIHFLRQNEFKGRSVKMRMRDKSNKTVVRTLAPLASPA